MSKSHFHVGAIGAAIVMVLASQGLHAADPATGSAAASAAAQGGSGSRPAAAVDKHERAAATPSASTSASAALSRDERKFIEKAAIGSMMEVELGKLAQQRGSAAAVKEFGARMVQDHGKAVDEIKQLASDKSVKIPDRLDAAHQKTVDKFSKTSAADFDRKYAGEMVKDHKKDIADFEKASKRAKDPQVKGFADKTLPTLREHLKMAQSAQASVRKSSN